MVESEGIKEIVSQVIVQMAITVMMALRDADAGP